MNAALKFLGMAVCVCALQGCLVEVSDSQERPGSSCLGSCAKVPVKIAYQVQDRDSWDGENRVIIEALPDGDAKVVASTEISTYSAEGSGETTLFLEPGDYCVRGHAQRRVSSPAACSFDLDNHSFVWACSEGGKRYESRSFEQCFSVESETDEHEVQIDIEIEG